MSPLVLAAAAIGKTISPGRAASQARARLAATRAYGVTMLKPGAEVVQQPGEGDQDGLVAVELEAVAPAEMVDVRVGVDHRRRFVTDMLAGQRKALPGRLDPFMQSMTTRPSSPSTIVRFAMSLLRAWYTRPCKPRPLRIDHSLDSLPDHVSRSNTRDK
ncbi:MAG TPA: hypothetical protein VHN16_05790 [Streptosporangiaceae bacterium]|nr:hypothetical protein [Streptosporangiaceae bacterium]